MQDALIQNFTPCLGSLFLSQILSPVINQCLIYLYFQKFYFLHLLHLDVIQYLQYNKFLQFATKIKLKQQISAHKVDMALQRKYIDTFRSQRDKSIYNIFYPLPNNILMAKLISNVQKSDFIKAGAQLGYVQEIQAHRNTIQAPISGTVVEIKPIQALNVKGKMLHIFSIKQCQHFPKDKNQGLPQNQIMSQTNSILQTADVCTYCQQQIWFYYQKNQNQITYRQLKKSFQQFCFSDFQWKVVLNQQYTKDTEIGGTYDESYSIKGSGKVTFLYQFSKGQPLPQTVVLKYKKVVCKHQKISSGICVFCLTDIKSLKQFNLRRYLFQFDQQRFNINLFLSGKALQDQANQFKNKLISSKKALLVLDLDNTILHSISLRRVNQQMLKQLSQYAIIPPEQNTCVYIEKTLVKFRPNFQYFLSKIVDLFQIFIYTKGTRAYAEQICRVVKQKYPDILKNTKNFLPHRIISRDEDPNFSKKNLQYLIPKNREIILILDDRRDVWNHSPLCVFTRPFVFFYEVAVTSDGKTKLEPVEWEKGGGTIQHKLNQFQEKCLKQIQQAQRQGKQSQAIKKIDELKQQIQVNQKNDQLNSNVVICPPQANLKLNKQLQDQQLQDKKVQTGLPSKFNEQSQQKNLSNAKIINQDSSLGNKQQSQEQKQKSKEQQVKNKLAIIQKDEKQQNNARIVKYPQNTARELKNNSNVADQYLVTTLFSLKQAHNIYFQKLALKDDQQKKQGKFADLSLCFQQFKKKLLDHISVYFVARDYKKLGSYRRSQKMGLRIVQNTCQKIDLIIRPNNLIQGYAQAVTDKYHELIVKKLKSLSQPKKTPIVSQSWIDVCYQYNCCVHHSFFQPSDPYTRQIYPNEAQISMAAGLATVSAAKNIKKILSGNYNQVEENFYEEKFKNK